MLIGHILCFLTNVFIAIFCVNQAQKEAKKEDPSLTDISIYGSLAVLNCVSAAINIAIPFFVS